MASTSDCDGWSDTELVMCARSGDRAAFAELVLRHQNTARVLAERMLDDAELARDASQEAAVVAMLSLDRLAAPERFGPWLCGIALNVARRWLWEWRRLHPMTVIDQVDPGPRPDELAEAADLAARIRRAVAGLAPGQREAVLLFYLEGLSHREVATELAISLGAVKARLHQGRHALAAALATQIDAEITTKEVRIMPSASTPDWIDVDIAEIRRAGPGDPGPCPHVAILREKVGDRALPIWMGQMEAIALARSLENVQTNRPMTYQFAAELVDAAGATVQEVRVTTIAEGTFYAVVVVDGPAGQREVDSRPSDALNLALVQDAPVRVAPEVLDSAAGREIWERYPTRTAALAAEAPACSFCGKTNEEVDRLIAGPGIYICDQCLGQADQILRRS